MDADFNPLTWELEQTETLKKLADHYGWDEDNSKYKQENLKGIQAWGKLKLNEMLGKGGEKGKKLNKSSLVWESIHEISAKGWDEAKSALQKIKGGAWVSDRRCAQSTSQGLVARRFMMEDLKAGKRYLGRLTDYQNGKFMLQRGIVEDIGPQGEDSDDDDQDEDGEDGEDDTTKEQAAEARRGAEAPGEGQKKAAAAAPEEAAPVAAPSKKRRARK